MRSPLPIPPKIVAALALAFLLAGCQPGSNPRAVPSVPQIGGDLKCEQGDHGYSDPELGWGFCYPSTWRYTEKIQATDAPSGVDLTFDITCISNCPPPCPAGSQGSQCERQPGLFGYMIISTDDRRGAADLASWLSANLPQKSADDAISWGNAKEAVKLADGRRVALTAHSVVILDLHPSPLDLEGEMSSRLGTWKFTY
jgi:hypothetical protein